MIGSKCDYLIAVPYGLRVLLAIALFETKYLRFCRKQQQGQSSFLFPADHSQVCARYVRQD